MLNMLTEPVLLSVLSNLSSAGEELVYLLEGKAWLFKPPLEFFWAMAWCIFASIFDQNLHPT